MRSLGLFVSAVIALSCVWARPASADGWGRVQHRCEGERTVYYSRVQTGGSWETACRRTPFPAGALQVRFRQNANMSCAGAACECTGGDCATLDGMTCVHRGLDGMWGEVRVRDATCRSTGAWGAFKKDTCADGGKRDKYYARIAVSKGDWKRACENTAAQINKNFKVEYKNVGGRMTWTCDGAACLNLDGSSKGFSAQCVHRGADGMWMEAFLEDASCPIHWDTFAKTCPAIGTAKYEARLWGVADGVSWEEKCRETPADYNGDGISVRPNADQCVKDLVSSGMWSRFVVADETCVKTSFNDDERLRHCVADLPRVEKLWKPRLEQLAGGASPASLASARAPSAGATSVAELAALARARYQGTLTREQLSARVTPLTDHVRATLTRPGGPLSAVRGENDNVLIYTVGAGGSAGAFFGLGAEQGMAAWFDARENARGYTSFAYSGGVQLGAGAAGVFGIWTVKDLASLGGDSWGCSVGASTAAGPGAAFTAWYDYENHYLGATLAPGVGVGAPVQATLIKVHTFVY